MDLTDGYYVTIKKDENIAGALSVPEPKKGTINEGFAHSYDYEEETDNEVVLLLGEQYNSTCELNIQIQGDTTQNFKLKITFPRAPFNALGVRTGVSGDQKFVYPNDVLEMPMSYLYFETLGLSPEKIFVTNLAERPFDDYGFDGRTSWRQNYSPISEEKATQGVRVRAFRFSSHLSSGGSIIGGKVQVTTPKGSFIVMDERQA